jgi:hypothetical protein
MIDLGGRAFFSTATAAWLRGFRPIRDGHCLIEKTPKSRSSTRSPRAIAAIISPRIALTNLHVALVEMRVPIGDKLDELRFEHCRPHATIMRLAKGHNPVKARSQHSPNFQATNYCNSIAGVRHLRLTSRPFLPPASIYRLAHGPTPTRPHICARRWRRCRPRRARRPDSTDQPTQRSRTMAW